MLTVNPKSYDMGIPWQAGEDIYFARSCNDYPVREYISGVIPDLEVPVPFV